jgi:hypothetical protein
VSSSVRCRACAPDLASLQDAEISCVVRGIINMAVQLTAQRLACQHKAGRCGATVGCALVRRKVGSCGGGAIHITLLCEGTSHSCTLTLGLHPFAWGWRRPIRTARHWQAPPLPSRASPRSGVWSPRRSGCAPQRAAPALCPALCSTPGQTADTQTRAPHDPPVSGAASAHRTPHA